METCTAWSQARSLVERVGTRAGTIYASSTASHSLPMQLKARACWCRSLPRWSIVSPDDNRQFLQSVVCACTERPYLRSTTSWFVQVACRTLHSQYASDRRSRSKECLPENGDHPTTSWLRYETRRKHKLLQIEFGIVGQESAALIAKHFISGFGLEACSRSSSLYQIEQP